MAKRYVLALDQGTTSSRAIVFDADSRAVAVGQRELTQHFPAAGWVEHDAEEIWRTQHEVAVEALSRAGIGPGELAAVGIANQRETAVVWDRRTGAPIHRAVVWQSRQSAGICEALRARGLEAEIRERTGLVLDAYFSGTKVRWILDRVPGAQARAERGELLFGTVDSWLIWKLTGGRVHVTDCSNASRTLLYDIHRLRWDERLLEALAVPREMLPEVRGSSEVYGETEPALLGGVAVPIAGAAGDQQAALFGQGCFQPGTAKNTYGTGCFMLMNTGPRPRPSQRGLLTTVAWGLGGAVEYALEGSVFVAGSAVQWLRDGLRLIEEARDTEYLAGKVPDAGGVVVVPAFVGLGAPHWDMRARGAIFGLTRGTRRAHLVRATLEAMAYQTRDVLAAMEADSAITLRALKVDGGAVANDLLMQFQADILGVPVVRPAVTETTAMGAAHLAGLATGVWRSREELAAAGPAGRTFLPAMERDRVERLLRAWRRAVERTRGWEEEPA